MWSECIENHFANKIKQTIFANEINQTILPESVQEATRAEEFTARNEVLHHCRSVQVWGVSGGICINFEYQNRPSACLILLAKIVSFRSSSSHCVCSFVFNPQDCIAVSVECELGVEQLNDRPPFLGLLHAPLQLHLLHGAARACSLMRTCVCTFPSI